MINSYALLILKNNKKLYLPIKGNDTNHAQAQAKDILRSLDATGLELKYINAKENLLSVLFENLAFNLFTFNECFEWTGSYTNKAPCNYVFGKRYYVKDIILKYLDIPKDRVTAKCGCKNVRCVNPYHFEYYDAKNSKFTGGDLKMLVAYRSQGTDIAQLAEAFKVHRSTIYRKLKHERLSIGATHHS